MVVYEKSEFLVADYLGRYPIRTVQVAINVLFHSDY